MELRVVSAAELPALVPFVGAMLEGTKFQPPSMEKSLRLLSRPNGFAVAAWDGDQPIGLMLGYVGEMYLNDDVCAWEQGLFVAPERRGGTLALRLIRIFEQWAKQRGASKVWLGQSVNHRRDSTLKFFERLGYECQGFITCKDIR
jgi:GNAT superfamily N-acetyltransferase